MSSGVSVYGGPDLGFFGIFVDILRSQGGRGGSGEWQEDHRSNTQQRCNHTVADVRQGQPSSEGLSEIGSTTIDENDTDHKVTRSSCLLCFTPSNKRETRPSSNWLALQKVSIAECRWRQRFIFPVRLWLNMVTHENEARSIVASPPCLYPTERLRFLVMLRLHHRNDMSRTTQTNTSISRPPR